MATGMHWRRKAAIVLWTLTLSALIILLILNLLNQFYKLELFKPIWIVGIACPLLLCLGQIALALNRWKSIWKNPF